MLLLLPLRPQPLPPVPPVPALLVPAAAEERTNDKEPLGVVGGVRFAPGPLGADAWHPGLRHLLSLPNRLDAVPPAEALPKPMLTELHPCRDQP
jgi:hypothetical protein